MASNEALPRAKPKASAPRMQLAGADELQGAVLETTAVRFGDSTSLRFEAQPQQESLRRLWAGLILSTLCPVYFRDVVHRGARDGEVHRHSTHKEHEQRLARRRRRSHS